MGTEVPSDRPGFLRLINARRLHTWRGALDTCSLATRGPGPGTNAAGAVSMEEMPLDGVIGITECTPAAEAALAEIPEWRR